MTYTAQLYRLQRVATYNPHFTVMLYEGYKVVGRSHGEPFLGSRAQESKRITYGPFDEEVAFGSTSTGTYSQHLS